MVEVRRSDVFEDLINVYKDPSISETRLFIKIAGETGIDVNGVSREIFTLFWQQFRTSYCHGNTEFTPAISPKCFVFPDALVAIGRILHHGFILHGILPAFFSKATMVCLLTPDIPLTQIVLPSFFKFLPPREADALQHAMQGYLVDECDRVQQIFSHFCFSGIPSQATLADHVHAIAFSVLVATPYYFIMKMKEGLQGCALGSEIWRGLGEAQVVHLLDELQPSAEKVAQCISTQPCSEKEQLVCSWLLRYVSNLEPPQLPIFLRFVTGMEYMTCTTKITVQFEDPLPQSTATRSPKACICFCTLILHSLYDRYEELKDDFDHILINHVLWGLDD